MNKNEIITFSEEKNLRELMPEYLLKEIIRLMGHNNSEKLVIWRMK
jgi:hypothetical protein